MQVEKQFDASSVFDLNSEHGSTYAAGKPEENKELARKETKAVSCLRLGVMFVLLTTATCVAALAFLYIARSEYHEFELQFQDQGLKITDSFISNAGRRMGTIKTLSKQITSYAITSNSSWPFVTIPHYEVLGGGITQLADVLLVIFSPIISEEKRLDWERYSQENKDWIWDSIHAQAEGDFDGSGIRYLESLKDGIPGLPAANMGVRDEWVDPSKHRSLQSKHPSANIPYEGPPLVAIDSTKEDPLDYVAPTLHRIDKIGLVPEDGPGPYVINWQIAPYPPVPQAINFNYRHHPNFEGVTTAVFENKLPAFGKAAILVDEDDAYVNSGHRDFLSYFIEKWKDAGKEFEDGPVSIMLYPVFDKFDKDRKVVGVLRTDVYWNIYFTNILPEGSIGMIVVLENTCDQSFTFEINGAHAKFLGEGDLHDTQYDNFELSTNGEFFGGTNTINEHEGNCQYTLRVYPSTTFEAAYVTNKPAVYTIMIVLIFAFTSAVFIVYDYLVERRQRVVMDSAVKSNAIVSSLFPENVRDRLYEVGTVQKEPIKKENLLNKYLRGDEDAEELSGNLTPIADSFPNCTVLFADLAGFTSWSANRQPEHVFKLLEGLYGPFDRIAKKRGVFKVETIGDCYLAVTGLPNPRKDHAVVMVRFAHECLVTMEKKLATNLGDELGADTAGLKLRVGLHSGPVTAGVLRGEKSRFQLFGDTVNTAARMESTGVPGRIQVSQSTADLLLESGKECWITRRDDVVNAKGKGVMQTYWASPTLNVTKTSMSDIDGNRAESPVSEVESDKAGGEIVAEKEEGNEQADFVGDPGVSPMSDVKLV